MVKDCHTIPSFNDPETYTFMKKHGEKKKNCWKSAFTPFSIMFSTLSRTEIIIVSTFVLSYFEFGQGQTLFVWERIKSIYPGIKHLLL